MKREFFCFAPFRKLPVSLFFGLGLVVLGPRAEASRVSPLGAVPPATNAVAVGVVAYTYAALRADGTVAQWGNGGSDPAISNVVSLSTGWSHALGLQTDGTVVGWNDSGSLIVVPAGLSNVVTAVAGDNNSLVIHADGTVAGWGVNSGGMLDVPGGLSDVVAVSIGTFGTGAFALRADGTVMEWGYGITNSHPEISNAVAVAISSPSFKAVAHCDGSVTAWPAAPPVPPDNLTNIIAVAGIGGHMFALRDNGTVTVWGYSSYSLPNDLTNVAAIASGGGDGIDLSIFLMDHTNPPPVLSINQSNSLPRLTLAGQKFHRYVVEESTDLSSSTSWKFKRNIVLPVTAQSFIDLPAATVGARFYRARTMP